MVVSLERVTGLPELEIESLEANMPEITLVADDYAEQLDKIGRRGLYGIISAGEARELAEEKEDPVENNLRRMRIAEVAIKHGMIEPAA